MAKNKVFRYYVEGDDDRKLIDTLKSDFQNIQPGRVEKFNVVQNEFKIGHVRVLKPDTTVVLVFDTDTVNCAILMKNIDFLLKQKGIIKEIICIPQVSNLEDELVRSCNIRQIKELTKSKSNREFKTDILHISNLKKRLEECEFDFLKFWSSSPVGAFAFVPNDSEKIKKVNKNTKTT